MPALPSIYLRMQEQRDRVLKRREKVQRFVKAHRVGSRFRTLLPYVAWLMYCSLGTVIFYIIESNLAQFPDHRATDDHKCISTVSSAFFFTMAACTTIGFGVVYPCTSVGRALSVLFIACGVPQLVIVLADIGTRLCDLMVFLVRSCRAKRREETIRRQSMFVLDLEDGSAREREKDALLLRASTTSSEDQEVDIPVSLGIGLTLTCFVWCGLYFYAFESNPWWESIYASSLTFLAGDYVATNFSTAGPFFGVVIIGFAMLSTTIQMVRNNIDNLTKRLQRDVDRKIEQMKTKVATGEITEGHAEEILSDILKDTSNNAGIYSTLLSQRTLTDMLQHTEETIEHSAIEAENDNLRKELDEATAILREYRRIKDSMISTPTQARARTKNSGFNADNIVKTDAGFSPELVRKHDVGISPDRTNLRDAGFSPPVTRRLERACGSDSILEMSESSSEDEQPPELDEAAELLLQEDISATLEGILHQIVRNAPGALERKTSTRQKVDFQEVELKQRSHQCHDCGAKFDYLESLKMHIMVAHR